MKLKDIGKIVTGKTPSTKQLENFSELDDKYLFVTPRDMKDNCKYIESTERYLTSFVEDKFKSQIIKKDSVCISCIGSDMGKVYMINRLGITNQQINSITDIKDICNPHYLYYYFSDKKEYLKGIASGSTMPILNKSTFENIEIDLPARNIQDKIVKILNNIDNKIELNNQTNDNLYKMMKIKFEDWITNLNKYEVSSLSKMANYTNGLAMQKFRPKDNEESLPVIKIKEMNDGITENTERCSTNIKDEVIINNGDVLFAWSGTLCMSIWGKGKAGLNQHIFKVTSDKYPKWFYYFWTLKHLNKFKMIAAGKATTMGHIKRGELDISEVLIPEDKELQEMHKIMQPLFNKYINNLIQNETLTQLRDTLLPKLMNGEIDLDKIEN